MDSEVLIVGGGLNGTLLALALARAGLTNTIVDAHALKEQLKPGFDGRGYALALASQRMLSALGLWKDLANRAQPILEIKVSDGHAGQGASPFFLHFDHAEIEEGPMGFVIEDRYLRPVLIEALAKEERITHCPGETVVGQTADLTGAALDLSSGKSLAGHVIVGADGRQSATAAHAGIGRIGWDYGQTALVCAVKHERPHQGIAHQFFMPEGPLAILPLPGNTSSIVWTETTERAAEISTMDEAAYLEVLRPRFGDFLGKISLAGARFSYPLSLSLAKSFVAPRLALVGDAAHGIHPIAGQGLNAGLRDIAALTETLAGAHRRGEDIGSKVTLEAYQQWRRFDTTTLALATDGFNRLFSNDNGALRLLRDLGMGAVNALPGLRRSLIREAAGLTGDLPRLLQGKPV